MFNRCNNYNNHMGNFVPHSFNTKITIIDEIIIPEIIISDQALNKMWNYVDIAEGEVSWLGTVDTPYANAYLIKDVFLLKQRVSDTHTDITTEGLSEFCQEILNMKDGLTIWNKIKFWAIHTFIWEQILQVEMINK